LKYFVLAPPGSHDLGTAAKKRSGASEATTILRRAISHCTAKRTRRGARRHRDKALITSGD
jgi:hypothetical protein